MEDIVLLYSSLLMRSGTLKGYILGLPTGELDRENARLKFQKEIK